jgi:hypothetical protein
LFTLVGVVVVAMAAGSMELVESAAAEVAVTQTVLLEQRGPQILAVAEVAVAVDIRALVQAEQVAPVS